MGGQGHFRWGRYELAIVLTLFLATLIGYLARSSVSVSLTFISSDFGWTTGQYGALGGLLMGVFLISYGLSNMLISPLIDIYGPRKVLVVAVLSWSVLTFLTGIVGVIYWVFVSMRFMLGLSQGVLFPAASKVTQMNFPPAERSRVNGAYLASMYASNLVISLLLLPLIISTDWKIGFFVVAVLGSLLLIPIWIFLGDGYVVKERRTGKELMTEVFTGLLLSARIKGFWRMVAADGATNIVWWGISLWLPGYLILAKGIPIEDVVWASALPYLGGIFGVLIGSYFSDRTARRSEISAIFSLCGAGSVIALLMLNDLVLVILAVSMIFFFTSLITANVFTFLQAVAPKRLVGSATGLMNGVSNGIGVLGPLILGLALALTGSYDAGIYMMATLLVIAAIAVLSYRRFERENPDLTLTES